jgi:hypothetical protein
MPSGTGGTLPEACQGIVTAAKAGQPARVTQLSNQLNPL